MLSFAAAPFATAAQTHLDPSTLTRYLDPLPTPAKLSGTVAQTITISEFTQQVLPSNFTTGPYGGKTLVWGYNNSYPGPTVEARTGTAFPASYVNNLNNPALLANLPIDQTLHWPTRSAATWPRPATSSGIPGRSRSSRTFTAAKFPRPSTAVRSRGSRRVSESRAPDS